jgi:micrococcal nuclease
MSVVPRASGWARGFAPAPKGEGWLETPPRTSLRSDLSIHVRGLRPLSASGRFTPNRWRNFEREALAAPLVLAFLGVGCGDPAPCAPARAHVERVVDGDTVVLEGGERVRYRIIDTPEMGDAPECYGPEAAAFNRDLVAGREVHLAYADVCRDRHGRLLADVSVEGLDVSAALVERGYACVRYLPDGPDDRVDALRALEDEARAAGRGLWGACARPRCAR